MEFLQEIDKAIFLFFNALLIHPILDWSMPLATEFKNWLIPGIAAAVVFVFKEKKKALIVLGLGVATVAICDQASYIIKVWASRPRPCHPDFLVEGGRYLVRGEFLPVGEWKSLRSFPSSHASNMFSVAALLTCFYKKRWPYFFVFAAMIGYTRVYCGVHYPFDVLAGAVLGVGFGVGVYKVYTFVKMKLEKRSVGSDRV